MSSEAAAAGNQAVADQDFVMAVHCYSKAIATNKKDQFLHSNRSLAFLKLNMTARALADAEEALRRNPNWHKAHFRKAEALAQAGLYAEALQSYLEAARIDPADEYLRSKMEAAVVADKAQRRSEFLVILSTTMAGFLLIFFLAVTMPKGDVSGDDDSAAARRKRAAQVVGPLGRLVGILLGTAVGAGIGFAANLLLVHHRRGAVLPPLISNDEFAATKILGADTSNDALHNNNKPNLGNTARSASATYTMRKGRGQFRSVKGGRAAALRAHA